MEKFFEVKNITKSLVLEGRKQQILNGINLEVSKGEFVALMGPSGSGKSTLLGIIGTLDKPDTGKILIDNKEIQDLSESSLAQYRNDNIGVIFQSYQLMPNLNAWENVATPMYISKNKSNIKQRSKEILDSVGLNDKYNNLPKQLSGGQQQRVAIARALANQPKILLADEPTGNLDSRSGKQIIDLFKKLQKELGLTLIVATHDAGIASVADRVIYLADGYITAHV